MSYLKFKYLEVVYDGLLCSFMMAILQDHTTVLYKVLVE